VLAACEKLVRALRDAGIRVTRDQGRGSFGRRVTDWEIKGVPLRIEVGPRDLAQGVVTVVRRDSGEKIPLAIDAVGTTALDLLDQIQRQMFEDARRRRDEQTRDVSSVDEAVEAAQSGFARLAWDLVEGEGEGRLNAQAVSVRCLQRADGSMPRSDTEAGLTCLVAKSY